MNDINEMPPKCQYCPYWEVCEYPWVCPDREQLATNLQQTCNQLATDTISRQAAIEAIEEDKIDLTNPNVVAVFKATGDFEKVETQVMTCDRHIKILKDLPSERKHGKWVKAKGSWCTPGGDPVWECSECGKGRHVYGIEHGSYGSDVADGQWVSCPNCGVDMREDSNESKERS